MSELLTTYGVLPPCYRTHLTVKLPACVPPPIELEQGLFTLLLSGPTTRTKNQEFYPKIQKSYGLFI